MKLPGLSIALTLGISPLAALAQSAEPQGELNGPSAPSDRPVDADFARGIGVPALLAQAAQKPTAPASAGSSSDNKRRVAADDTHSLEEIVVTAEKRESTVQKTPVSMTAISGVELEARGLAGFRSVAQETPGVSFRTSGPGQTEYEIRGLTSSGGFSPTVGFYVDDAPLTAPAQAAQGKIVIDPDLYDINRIEVLRGPQGTLYGAGSMGGTIKLITNSPQLNQFSFSAQTVDSNTESGGLSYGVSAMINVPLANDTAALRVVGTDKYVSGWIDRIVLSPFPLEANGGATRGDVLAAPVQQTFSDVNWERLQAARASVLLQFGERLTIRPTIMYQKITQGSKNTIDNPPGGQYAHYQPFDIAEPSEDNFNLYTVVVNYHFDPVDVTSATSKWNRHDTQAGDIAETMQFLFGFPSYDIAGGGVGAGTQHITDQSSQATEEIRLSSTGTGRMQWLFGLYYSDFNTNSKSHSVYAGFANIFGTDNLIDTTEPIEITQRAVFGEASYKFTDQLKATVGLRWYHYTSTEKSSNSGLASIAGGPGTIYQYANASNSGFNPKVNLAYTLSDDVLLYTTAAKGFRPGGPNTPIPLSGPVQCLTGPGNLESLGLSSAPNQFNPDGVWSYEAGEKGRALNGRLIINSDVYYENWSNVQQAVDPSCGFPFTANAGAATIYGAEIELTASLTPSWTISQNFGLTHATFNETVLATATVKGAKVLDVPDSSATTSLAYRRPVAPGIDLIARGSYTYVGPMEDITYVRNKLAGYGLGNLRVGVAGHGISAFLFVDNVANKKAVLTNSVADTVNVPIFNRVVTSPPRIIGIDFQYRYQ